MDTVQSLEVQISPIHDVERPGFDGQFVEDVDIVNLAGGNNDKGWNASMKVQQRMQFDRRFASSEFRPGEQGQAKIGYGRFSFASANVLRAIGSRIPAWYRRCPKVLMQVSISRKLSR